MASPHPFVLEEGRELHRAPLALLHGSHGSEQDLLPMARRIAPATTRVALRGAVPLEEGHAHVRRRPDRTVDEADLRGRVPALIALLDDLVRRGRLTQPPVLLGFSNGAIMAAAVAATHPGALAGAVLLRPLSPYSDDASYVTGALPVLVVDGADDARRRPEDGLELARRLRRSGARVSHVVLPVAHAVTSDDEVVVRAWLDDEAGPRGRGAGVRT